MPFITEEIYQNLVFGINSQAPESVHLCRWPEYNETLVDSKLEKEMELAYKICGLGRSTRNLANIKNRQPLPKMLVSTNELPDYYIDIIKEELNIKEVVVNANMSDYVSYMVKPNLPVLGKTYGKLLAGIKKEIAEANQIELALKVSSGQSITINVDGTSIELNSDNLLVTMNGLDGFAVASEGEVGVVLDTHISEELKSEGYAREIISKLQNMRKDSSFEVVDKITIYMGGNDLLETIVQQYKEYIMSETLAVDIVFNAKCDYTEVNINGEKLRLAVERIS